MPVKLSIVICAYNKANFTVHCVKSLLELPKDEVEIILIDNASTDNTRKQIDALQSNNLRYIYSSINLFHSGGCNVGYELAQGENILFLNNDIKMQSKMNWTNKLNEDITIDPNTLFGITAGYIDPKKDFNFCYEAIDPNQQFNYISGWFIAAKRETWEKLKVGRSVGPWNEKFPMYFNDGDLSFRAKKLGIDQKLIQLPIQHIGKVSSSQLNIPKLYNTARKVFIEQWKEKSKK